jgi:hypothetical protein
MTSVLNVDTIADKAGTGPVALTKQSAAKAFALFDQTVPEINDSFNTSSLTDTSTGRGDLNWTNSMSNTTYTSASNIGYFSVSNAYSGGIFDDSPISGKTRTTSKFYFAVTYGNNTIAAFLDYSYLQVVTHGELA